ncbi:MAG: ABC transporter substrate-binding protein [Bacteroidota bacterium]|nr:ABC transporter substrate-binding protein [Bacteroidota bacterium]
MKHKRSRDGGLDFNSYFCSMKFKFIILLIGSILLSSCARKVGIQHTLRDGKGGKKLGGTFRINETADLRSLDPVQMNDQTSVQIGENVYDRLLEFDLNLNLIPGLSTLPEISPDGTTYTFHLRTDAYFHDDPCFSGGKGRKFVASDVIYCYTRALDKTTNTGAEPYFKYIKGGAAYYESGKLPPGGLPGLQAPNDSTVVITLEHPFSPFLNYPAVGFGFIYPHEAVEHYGRDFVFHPVGTGAFRFIDYKQAQHCLLVRNPRYWKHDSVGNQLPYLDTVNFTFILDNKVELQQFVANQLDHVYRIPSEFFQDVVDEHKEPKGKYKKYQLIHVPAMAVQFYGFNVTTPPMNNRHLRRAIAFAVDRDKIIKYILKGQAAGPGVHGIVPPCMPGYPVDLVHGFSFNADSAMAELALAKQELGGTIPDLTLYLNAGGGRNTEVAEAIQSQLKENLGLTINLQMLEFSQLTPRIDDGKAPFFRLGWIADYPSPENFLNLLYGKNIPPSGPSTINSTRFRNPEFDRLFEAAINETDRSKTNTLFAQAENLAIQDAPYLVLYYDEDYHLLQPNVRDFPANAMYQLDMKYCWFSE